jgi:hypothetical protein
VGPGRAGAHAHTGLTRVSPQAEARGRRAWQGPGDQRVGRRLPPDGQRGQVTDLYRELAIHRVQDAIDKLGRAPSDRLAAQTAEVLEEAAAALACITAVYVTPGGRLDERFQQQISNLIAAAASLEQLADFSRHTTTGNNHDH